MRPRSLKAHVEMTARSFDAELHADDYLRVTADPRQLDRLLRYLSPEEGQILLDLGTGAGYVAFEIAQREPHCFVVGVDVARGAIENNARKAREQSLRNAHFAVSDGVGLPFVNRAFDGAVCRYAFHHFPVPKTTLAEIARTLRPGGRLVLSDAIRSPADNTDFINKFQRLKRDGHVRMYFAGDLIDLLRQHGFTLADSFMSSISFSRNRSRRYDTLIASTPSHVKRAYCVAVEEGAISLTFPILNVLLRNRLPRGREAMDELAAR